MRKVKKPTLSKAKARAWKEFSLFIRSKGKVGDNNMCVTCKRWYPVKTLQAGHFLPGRHPSVLFDERNCHPQCYGCNIMKKGNTVEYYEYMLETYGPEVIAELRELDKEVSKMKVYMYQSLEEKYKSFNQN